MLILSRSVGEKIFVEGGITVIVTEIRDGLVRIGIEAPDDVLILREEVSIARRLTIEGSAIGPNAVRRRLKDERARAIDRERFGQTGEGG